jgi:hypothetical protein
MLLAWESSRAMADQQRELEIAKWVAIYSERYRGKILGEPILNDDGSGDLLFDVLFDKVSPPVALEVTSIVHPPFIATARVADPVAEEMTLAAIDEGLGRWYINVVAGTRLRPIAGDLLDVIRAGGGRLPAGVIDVSQADDGEPGVVIGTWSSSGAVALPGFTQELIEAVSANEGKLALAERYERHLAVDLRALRASDPSSTPAPDLPPSIDLLWVVRTTITQARVEPLAWWSDGGEWSTSHDWWS